MLLIMSLGDLNTLKIKEVDYRVVQQLLGSFQKLEEFNSLLVNLALSPLGQFSCLGS